ncbi:heterokaryon incompatibility protein 6,OR allele [Hyaloscypha variabilis]
MGLLNYFGAAAVKISTSQNNSTFYLIRSPLFNQFLHICVLNFPDPLDLYAWSYEIVPIYFFAGVIDFGIMVLVITLYSQFAACLKPKVDSDQAGPLLSELTSPESKLFRGLLLISFLLRAWRFGLGNIKRTCDIHRVLTQWSEMRKLAILILVLCPALFWHSLSELVLSCIKVERPWLSQIFWLFLSGDWETASLYSGFFVSKGKEVLEQERVAQLNETWTAFSLRVLKLTAFQVPLEIFVKNFAYIVIGLIVIVGRNAPLLASFTGKAFKRLQSTGLFRKLADVDKAVSKKRDYLLIIAVRCFRRGKVLWHKSPCPKYISHLSRCLTVYAKPLFVGAGLYIGSFVSTIPQKMGSTIKAYLRIGSSAALFSTIPSRRFRLLEVEPSLASDADINCRLAWHNLTTAPPYTAISYVWGSSELTSTIILNGEETKTTSSAHAALKGLRSAWRNKYFWIDAICIDQNNDTDKGEQISIMADIYRNAKQVTIWLGPEENGALALSLVRRLFIRTRLSDVMGPLTSGYSMDAPRPAWEAFGRLLQNPWFHRSWVVQEVMSSKVIVQYGDAKLDWTVLSRFAMAVENDLETMDKIYALTGNAGRGSSQLNTLNLKYIRIMEDFRSMQPRQLYGLNQISSTDNHLSLLFYLTRMFRSNCRFQATNTQDRIYALLNMSGLASDVEFNTLLDTANLLGNKTPKNTPDYGHRLAKFFTIAATHFLTSGPQTRRLDCLSHAGTTHQSQLPNLPSWVPDWSLEPTCNSFLAHDGTLELLQHPRLKGILETVADWQSYDEISFSERVEQRAALKKLHQMSQAMVSQSTHTIYSAANDSIPSFTIYEEEGILELKGGIINRLHSIGEPFPKVNFGGVGSHYLAGQAENIAYIAVTMIKWSALSQTALSLSRPSPSTPIDTQAQSAHDLFFERILLADVSHPTFDFTLPSSPVRPAPEEKLGCAAMLIGMTYKKIPYARLREKETRKRLAEWIAHLVATCKGRCFGVTEAGMMGLFPAGGKVGDEVALVDGMGLPILVRRVGEDEQEKEKGNEENEEERRQLYELIGPAYVHGIMDGEGMDRTDTAGSILLK